MVQMWTRASCRTPSGLLEYNFCRSQLEGPGILVEGLSGHQSLAHLGGGLPGVTDVCDQL